MSQFRTVSAANKNFQDILDMPNYSLMSWVPKTGKNKQIQRRPKKLGPIKVFFHIKVHVKERLGSLNEVCEGVPGVKNPTKKCCWP